MFWSSSLSWFTPVAEPIAKQAATTAIHIPMARHGWVALQRAIRTVAEPLGIVLAPPRSRPDAGEFAYWDKPSGTAVEEG
jgi:hypothetical protein